MPRGRHAQPRPNVRKGSRNPAKSSASGAAFVVRRYAGPLVGDSSDDDSTDSGEEEGEAGADDRHDVGGALGAGPLSHTRRVYRRKLGFVKQLTKKVIDADRAKYSSDGLTALMMRSHIGVLCRARKCSIYPTDSRLNSQTNNYRPVDQ